MTYSDETLMRWIDGELSVEDAAHIKAAAATDEALAHRLEALQVLRVAAREAFPAAPDPRDAALARLIATQGEASPTWAGRAMAWLADAFAPRRAPVWAGLTAAAFVSGVALGPMLVGAGDGLTVQTGGAVSDEELTRVLETRLVADGADNKGRAIGLTFQNRDGDWCRTFTLGETRLAGLACREDGDWAIKALAPVTGPSGEIRTAASETPEAILAAVDVTIAGETVDAVNEARARDTGWN